MDNIYCRNIGVRGLKECKNNALEEGELSDSNNDTSTNDSHNQPSCSFDKQDQSIEDIQIIHRNAMHEALVLKLKFNNDDYVGVVYKLRSKISTPNELNDFVEACRNGGGDKALDNWHNIASAQHGNVPNQTMRYKARNQVLRNEKDLIISNIPSEKLSNNFFASTSESLMLKKKHEPKNSTIVSKDVVHINGQNYDDTNTGPNFKNISKDSQIQTSIIQQIDIDDEDDERLIIDEPEESIHKNSQANDYYIKDISRKNSTDSNQKPFNYERQYLPQISLNKISQSSYNQIGSNFTKPNEVDFLSLNPSTNKKIANTVESSNTLHSIQTSAIQIQQSTSSISQDPSEVKKPIVNGLDQLVKTRTPPISKLPAKSIPSRTIKETPSLLDAKKFLALGGVIPTVAKKKRLNSGITSTLPQDQFSEADDRSMMDLELCIPSKTQNVNVKKPILSKNDTPITNIAVRNKDSAATTKPEPTTTTTSPESISSSVQSANLIKPSIPNEATYKVQRHSELQLKIVLDHTKREENPSNSTKKNVSDSPKISYNKPIQKDLQLPQQTESYRMIGKAPTAKPRVDFKEGSSIQSSIETRKSKMSNQKRIETLKNEPEIKNESINNLKLKSEKTTIPITEDPETLIKQVDSLPLDKNPNNIMLNDIVWAQGSGAPRWPGRATDLFEDGSIRVFWFPSSTIQYNDLPGNKVEKFMPIFARAFDPKRMKQKYIPAVAEAIKECLPERKYFENKLTKALALCLDKDEGVNIDGLAVKDGNRIIVYRSSDYGYDKKSKTTNSLNDSQNAHNSSKTNEPNVLKTKTYNNSSALPVSTQIPEVHDKHNKERKSERQRLKNDYAKSHYTPLSDEALAEAATRVDALLKTEPGPSIVSNNEQLHGSLSPETMTQSTLVSILPSITEIKAEPLNINEELVTGIEEEEEEIESNSAINEHDEINNPKTTGTKRRGRPKKTLSISSSKRLRYEETITESNCNS